MIKRNILLMLLIIVATAQAQNDAAIAALPADWTRLTKQGDEMVVYNTCDGGNLQLRLYKESGKWHILAHGQQEDYLFEVRKATALGDNITLNCVSEGTEDKQQFIFRWTNKPKGLARWEAKGWDWNDMFVSLPDEVNHLHIAQPCKECWEEADCETMDDYYYPIDAIRAVFSNYVHYGESTDSAENKAIMSKSLNKLKGKKLSQDDLQLLVNIWMYYDPTDFTDGISKSKELLIANKGDGIKAVKSRIAGRREWENEDSAPYSDLPVLLKELEGK
jgi:hypothetical protein